MSDEDYPYDPNSGYYNDPRSHHQSSRRRTSRQESYPSDYPPQDPSRNYYATPRGYHDPPQALRPQITTSTQGEHSHYTHHSTRWSDQRYAPNHANHQSYSQQQHYPEGSHYAYNPPVAQSHVQQSGGIDEYIDLEPEATVHTSVQPTLHSDYVFVSPDYFQPGIVFSLPWPENEGRTNATLPSRRSVVVGPFGENIYATIRRMVAFRVFDRCSWCFAINTYNHRGVAKRGVEPDKHAIVHLEDRNPFRADGEPRMIKEPLALRPDRPDEGLDRMSRINFGKIHTVEHNVRVRPLGRIADSSMARFREYVESEVQCMWETGR
ncbi:hypothetical protein BDW69DRAFT_124387 [Aspergillus filifer]